MSSTLQWLGRTTLALLVVVGLPQFADAAFIDLVSQSYRIQGYGYGYGLSADIGSVQYDETSNVPIHRADNVVGSTGGFFLSTVTDGGATDTDAFVEVHSNRFDIGDANAVLAEATAMIAFRPLVTNLIVQAGFPNPFGLMGSLGYAGLYDETVGAAVLALGSPIEPATYAVLLNLDHLYTIYASAEGPSHGARLSLTAGPVPTPESESTLTFFVLGLGAVLLVARSPKFRSSN